MSDKTNAETGGRTGSESCINFNSKAALRHHIGNDNKIALDLYKFYQERAETIRTRLWTTLTWLAGVQGAILVLQQQNITLRDDMAWAWLKWPICLNEPFAIFVASAFGIFFSLYMILVVNDGTKHIESNWHKADFALGKEEKSEKKSENILYTILYFIIKILVLIIKPFKQPVFGLMALVGIVLCLIYAILIWHILREGFSNVNCNLMI